MSALSNSGNQQDSEVSVKPDALTAPGQPKKRDILIELFVEHDLISKDVNPVRTQPRMAFLHWGNRDTLQFYAGGYDYSIYLGPNCDTYFGNKIPNGTIQLKRGDYSEILKLKSGGKPGGSTCRRLPEYQVWLGHGERPPRETVQSTSDSDIIFDP